MLRETRAKWLALATALGVVLLAAAFAGLRNAPAPASAVPPAPEAALSTQSRLAFERLGCAMCHSVGGQGNPDSPLDGVGGRLDRAAIHEWATGTGAARDPLPASMARRKARALGDPGLDALVDELSLVK